MAYSLMKTETITLSGSEVGVDLQCGTCILSNPGTAAITLKKGATAFELPGGAVLTTPMQIDTIKASGTGKLCVLYLDEY